MALIVPRLVVTITGKRKFPIDQPHIRAKIIGIIIIAIGIAFLVNLTSFSLKVGFAFILIGIIMIFLITERSIPKKISDAQIEGNLDVVKSITEKLNLKGNAVFLPKSHILSEERIFIPLTKSDNVKLPFIDTDLVFLTGMDGTSLGIAVPPSGLKLLNEVEKEAAFEHTKLEDIQEQLQTFVGMDLLKSVSFKKQKNNWNLELEKPSFCTHDEIACNQFPCPTCSAVLSAITRASKKKLWINDTTFNGKKTTFDLTLR